MASPPALSSGETAEAVSFDGLPIADEVGAAKPVVLLDSRIMGYLVYGGSCSVCPKGPIKSPAS